MARTANAQAGLNTGNREGKPARREQEILTPECVLEVVRSVWGSIALDPCSCEGLMLASMNYFGAREETGRTLKDGSQEVRWTGPGLTQGWVSDTYVNPPYEQLKLWLKKSRDELIDHQVTEQMLLFPVRPVRPWWCQYMATIPNRIAWLKPQTFVGYKETFPTPLVLVYTGMKHTEAFEDYASAIAHHIGGHI